MLPEAHRAEATHEGKSEDDLMVRVHIDLRSRKELLSCLTTLSKMNSLCCCSAHIVRLLLGRRKIVGKVDVTCNISSKINSKQCNAVQLFKEYV